MSHWQDIYGRRWYFNPPQTTKDVLDGALLALAPLLEVTSKGQMPGSVELAHLLDFLARVTVIEGMDHDERVEWIDMELTIDQQVQYLEAIKASVSIPAETLDHIQDYYDIAYDGGCECPVCEGSKDASKVACRYADIPVHVYQWTQKYAVLSDDPVLTAPWWVYQIKEIEKRAAGKHWRKIEKQRRRDERKREVDEQLRKMGIS